MEFPDFAEQFARRNDQIKAIKMVRLVRRALDTQARAKIKPNSMRPRLAEMSNMRKLTGGDAMDVEAPLNLYWPGR